jgi:hypothetical protein
MNKRATKHKSAPENSILKFPTVSSMSSDSIVKGIIDDIIKTAVSQPKSTSKKRKENMKKLSVSYIK